MPPLSFDLVLSTAFWMFSEISCQYYAISLQTSSIFFPLSSNFPVFIKNSQIYQNILLFSFPFTFSVFPSDSDPSYLSAGSTVAASSSVRWVVLAHQADADQCPLCVTAMLPDPLQNCHWLPGPHRKG